MSITTIQSIQQPLLIYPSNLYDTLQAIRTRSTYITDGVATLTGGRLSGLLPPAGPTDAASKQYVDTHSGGVPGGPIGSLQFNDNGTLNGSSNLLWTSSTNTITLLGTINVTTMFSSILVSTSINSISGLFTNITSSNIDSTSINSTNISVTSLNSNIINAVTGLYNNINVSYISGLADLTVSSPGDYAANKNYVDSKIGSNPSGPSGALQFNDNTIFGGSSNLVWITGTNTLSINGSISCTSSFISTDTTNSTSYNTGSVVLSGGLGVAQDVNIQGTCSANDFYTTSDIKFKQNIHELHNTLDIVNKIKCYSFNMKGSNHESWGFIAQQLEEIGLTDTVKEISGHKTVNYIQFIALLLESIKELNSEINQQKSIINNIFKTLNEKELKESYKKESINFKPEISSHISSYNHSPSSSITQSSQATQSPSSQSTQTTITHSPSSSITHSPSSSITHSPSSNTPNSSTSCSSSVGSIPSIFKNDNIDKNNDKNNDKNDNIIKNTDRKILRNKEYKYCFMCKNWILVINFTKDTTEKDLLKCYCNNCLIKIA